MGYGGGGWGSAGRARAPSTVQHLHGTRRVPQPGILTNPHPSWSAANPAVRSHLQPLASHTPLLSTPSPLIFLQTYDYVMLHPCTLWMVQQMCNHGTLIEAGACASSVPARRHAGMAGCHAAPLSASSLPVLVPPLPLPPPLPRPTPTPVLLPANAATTTPNTFTHTRAAAAVDRGWLRRKRSLVAPPDMRTVLRTLREVAQGMAFLHSRDVLHCDLTGGQQLVRSIALSHECRRRCRRRRQVPCPRVPTLVPCALPGTSLHRQHRAAGAIAILANPI